MYKYIFIILLLLAFNARSQNDSLSKKDYSNMKGISSDTIYPAYNFDMTKFVVDNLKYPEKGIKKKIEGKVYVQFIIEQSGKITNPVIIKGLGEEFDEEVLRIMKLMPDWTPGYLDGKPVRVKKVLPINFSLSNHSYKSTCPNTNE